MGMNINPIRFLSQEAQQARDNFRAIRQGISSLSNRIKSWTRKSKVDDTMKDQFRVSVSSSSRSSMSALHENPLSQVTFKFQPANWTPLLQERESLTREAPRPENVEQHQRSVELEETPAEDALGEPREEVAHELPTERSRSSVSFSIREEPRRHEEPIYHKPNDWMSLNEDESAREESQKQYDKPLQNLVEDEQSRGIVENAQPSVVVVEHEQPLEPPPSDRPIVAAIHVRDFSEHAEVFKKPETFNAIVPQEVSPPNNLELATALLHTTLPFNLNAVEVNTPEAPQAGQQQVNVTLPVDVHEAPEVAPQQQEVAPQPRVPTISSTDLAQLIRIHEEEVHEVQPSYVPSLVTSEQLQAARDYLDNAENQEFLARALEEAQAKGKPYVVLRKIPGLSYNIEYRGPGQALLRYRKDFKWGTYKMASKMADLYTGELLVKAKGVLTLPEEANRYKFARQLISGVPQASLQPYRTESVSLEAAEEEFRKGKDIPGVLQNKYFAHYTKEVEYNSKIEKVEKFAIYSIAQKGTVSANQFRTQTDKEQAAKGMIKNVAILHEKGLCHNDIKGPNFLWNRDKNNKVVIKTIDVDMLESANSLKYYEAGSPAFLPPEVIKKMLDPSVEIEHTPELHKAKDAFALGKAIFSDVYGFSLDYDGLKSAWDRDKTPFLNFLDKHDIDRGLVNTFFTAPQSMESRAFVLISSLLDFALIDHFLSFDEFFSEGAGVNPSMRKVVKGLLNPDPTQRMTVKEAEDILGI